MYLTNTTHKTDGIYSRWNFKKEKKFHTRVHEVKDPSQRVSYHVLDGYNFSEL